MLKKHISKNLINLNFFLILFIVFLPSNFNKFFNGIPIVSKFDLIFLFIIFPLVLFSLEFIKFRLIKYILILLTFLKIILFFAPENGIAHKMYFANSKDQDFIKTYSTFWNKNYSAVQKNDWNKKENFPIDWLPNTDKVSNSLDPYYYYTKKDFSNINLLFNSQFLILVREDSKIFLNLPSKNLFNIDVKNIDTNSEFKLKKNEINLNKGLYLFDIDYILKGKKFNFSPSIIKKSNKELSILNKNLAFLPHENINYKKQFFFQFSADIYDFLILVFIFILACKLFLILVKKIYLIKTFILIYGLTLVLSIFIQLFLINEKILIYKLNLAYSLSLIVFIIFFFCERLQIFKKFNIFENIKFDNFDYLFCFILPLVLIGFIRFYNEINGLSWWVPGDDGHTYQKFAREIVVDGEWLHPNTLYRQAPMYVYSFFHIVFGQSSFGQKIIEFYLVGLICFFTLKIILNITLNKNLALICSIILMIIFTGEKYTTFIGKGYTEYYAAFLIILSVFLLQKFHLSFFLYLTLFIFSLIGLGFREDHIFVIFSIIYYSRNFNYINLKDKSFLKKFYIITIQNYKIIFCFGFLVIFCFIILLIRNILATEDITNTLKIFEIVIPSIDKILSLLHPNLATSVDTSASSAYIKESFIHAYYRMFFGSAPWEIPRLTSIFLITGFVIAIFSILKTKKKQISLGSVLAIISILIPYTIVLNHGYEPRYTIHYLPFCLIIIAEYINTKFKNSKFFI